MARLNVRNVDDRIVALLKERAARHGRSAEAEHREILKQALIDDKANALRKEEARARMNAFRKSLEGRTLKPSEIMVRDEREPPEL